MAIRNRIEAETNASQIRYAQCWEDADILLEGLDPHPGDVCLSIASAGDNTLSLLAHSPARVVAIDLNPAQLACLELRIAAYLTLDHTGLLELIGSRPSVRRLALYSACRPRLSTSARVFWDERKRDIAHGIGSVGRFENYLSLFRRWVLPLIHSRSKIDRLLEGGTQVDRQQFYDNEWNTTRWRALCQIFFSRKIMARLGRDPRFFEYAEADIIMLLRRRICHAVTNLDPNKNPYLHWILKGEHGAELPFALRLENFDAIRANIDRLELRCQTLEEFLASCEPGTIDRANLSNVFEYMPAEKYNAVLRRLAAAARPGARIAYWNLLVPRSRPAEMAGRLISLNTLSDELHTRDKAFFYNNFIIEEIAA